MSSSPPSSSSPSTKSEPPSRPPMPHSLPPPQRPRSANATPSAPPLPDPPSSSPEYYSESPISPPPYVGPEPSAPPLPDSPSSSPASSPPMPLPPYVRPEPSAPPLQDSPSLSPESSPPMPPPPPYVSPEPSAPPLPDSPSSSPASSPPMPPSSSVPPPSPPPSPPPQDSSSSGSSPPSPKQLPAVLALVTWSEAMKECLNEGKAKAKKDEKGKGKAVVIGGGRPTVPPSLKDLLAKPITITDVLDRLITNPNNFNRYRTTKIIGNAAGEALVFKSFFLGFDSYPTYKDIRLGDFIFGLKVIDTDRQQDYKKLIEKVDKNLVIDHPNILGIKERIDYEDHFFCFAFPKMNKSLRSLMDTAFPDGFPRELVAIALKEVVQALVYIHQQGYYHQELNAGHVYFQRDGPAIKIGFLATIYEDNAKDGQINQDLESGSLARETICEWGAAPEIYNLKQEYTEKSDIWLVGITGMELAYRGLPVKDREQLQFLIERHLKITCRDVRGDEKKKSAVGKQLDKMKKKMGKWKGGSSIPISKPVGVSFKEMLALCLKEDPDERPTAEVLLQHDFFQICDNFDLNYFRKAVLEKKEKKK